MGSFQSSDCGGLFFDPKDYFPCFAASRAALTPEIASRMEKRGKCSPRFVVRYRNFVNSSCLPRNSRTRQWGRARCAGQKWQEIILTCPEVVRGKRPRILCICIHILHTYIYIYIYIYIYTYTHTHTHISLFRVRA